MSWIRNFFLVLATVFSASCLDQYNPLPFWEKIENERQMSLNPDIIVAADGRRISLGEDGKLVVAAADTPAYDPSADSAEKIYSGLCALCHGKKGEGVRGNPARAFTDAVWQREATDADIAWIIRNGTMALMQSANTDDDTEANGVLERLKARSTFKPLTGGMAAGGGRTLTDEQVEDLVQLIRSFSK